MKLETTRITELNVGQRVVIRKGNDDDYYVTPGNEYNNLFSVRHNFRRVDKNEGRKKYYTQSIKESIITKARKMSSWNSSMQEFIEWYDTLPVTPITQPIENEKDNAQMNELLTKIESLTVTISESQKRNQFEEAMLQGIIEKGKEIAVNDLQLNAQVYLEEFIRKTYGVLPQMVQIITNDHVKEMKGLFHKEFKKILTIVSQNVPLMLVGPAGSGKNHTVEQVAESLELDFYFSNAITQEYKLTGFIDANGNYHETEFYKSFKNGGLFFFDEIDASCAESLIVVNAALSNGYFDFPHEKVNAHENFRVVAAANTFGQGADMIYVGRNQLDGATLDRFAVVHFGYDEKIEEALCDDVQLFEFIKDMRRAIEKRSLRFIISMRATINASKLYKAGLTKNEIIKTVIVKGMNNDDKNVILSELREYNQWYDEFKLEAK